MSARTSVAAPHGKQRGRLFEEGENHFPGRAEIGREQSVDQDDSPAASHRHQVGREHRGQLWQLFNIHEAVHERRLGRFREEVAAAGLAEGGTRDIPEIL